MSWRGFVRALTLLLALVGAAQPALAHEMSMGELYLREMGPGEFIWSWGASGKSRPITDDLSPVWPQNCLADKATQTLRCGEGGLVGELAVKGVGEGYSAAIVSIQWRDDRTRVYTLTERQPTVQLFGGADDQRGVGEVASAYGLLGVEHILSGIDHLMFVISLLFLVGFRRRLIGTITAFTAAHSVTLAASALGWLTLRPPPVEATIALSIVLVAGEALRERQTLARRWPSLVAFLFGLVHGLGFAGALKDIGLPENHVPVALLTFNLGVEAGQLLVVALAWALTALLSRFGGFKSGRRPALYAIGTLAAYWSWLRIAAIAAG